MFVLLFLIVLGAGIFVVYRLLSSEIKINFSPSFKAEKVVPIDLPSAIDLPLQKEEMSSSSFGEAEKLQALLSEKNRIIERLQKELEAERTHRKDFETVKGLMDEEIAHLKEQLRNVRQKEQSNV